MTRFYLQTIHGEVVHDFVFTLIEAIKYYDWFDTGRYEACFQEPRKSGIPVGSVEFVCDWLKKYGYPVPEPRNVPIELFPFAGREILNGIESTQFNKDCFIKSNDLIKSSVNGVLKNGIILPPGNYQFSSLVDFTSECRAFVWRGSLVGLQNYSGEFTVFPNVQVIHNMIAAYKSAPCAYTLDVGIKNTGETCVVEVHDFFSCGLYGFADLQLLPLMFAGWFNEYKRLN